MIRRLAASLAMAVVLALPATAQGDRLAVPFAVGERLEYDVRFGKLKVGSGFMEVAGVQTIRGHDTWHTIFGIRGGTFFYRVDDRNESWFDTRTGNSLRFIQDLNEGRRDVQRVFDIYPERRTFIEQGEAEAPSVSDPLDDGSFLYFLRTIPLVVGQSYSFNRYFRPDRNPVTIRVLRKERVSVPAGDFDAIVVQPVINTKGVFSENGRAEVWLSDDSRRMMLQLKSGLSFGSINLYLRNIIPGRTTTGGRAP